MRTYRRAYPTRRPNVRRLVRHLLWNARQCRGLERCRSARLRSSTSAAATRAIRHGSGLPFQPLALAVATTTSQPSSVIDKSATVEVRPSGCGAGEILPSALHIAAARRWGGPLLPAVSENSRSALRRASLSSPRCRLSAERRMRTASPGSVPSRAAPGSPAGRLPGRWRAGCPDPVSARPRRHATSRPYEGNWPERPVHGILGGMLLSALMAGTGALGDLGADPEESRSSPATRASSCRAPSSSPCRARRRTATPSPGRRRGAARWRSWRSGRWTARRRSCSWPILPAGRQDQRV